MGAMNTRNMYCDFAVNKYLHAVTSCWILLIYFFYLGLGVFNGFQLQQTPTQRHRMFANLWLLIEILYNTESLFTDFHEHEVRAALNRVVGEGGCTDVVYRIV